MDKNAINTMLAHKMSMGDDNIFVKSKIEGTTLLLFGIVEKYTNGRVDVACGSVKFHNVEVIVLGVNGWGIKPVPAKGDRVLLLTSQAPVPDLAEFEAPGSMPAYDVSGMKAIPITDEKKATQLITVSADSVQITGDNKLTLNAEGVSLEDKNGNTITTAANEVALSVKDGGNVVIDNNFTTINGKLKVKV